METVTRRCDNCARAKEPETERELLPIRCTLRECWVERDCKCDKWVEIESDGFITDLEKDGKW